MSRVLLVAASLTLGVACAAPTSAPADAAADAGLPARAITLELRDAPVQDVVDAVSRAAEQPIVVDPDAEPFVRCAHIGVLVAKPTGGEQLARVLTDALEPSGLTLSHAPSGAWVVRRKPDTPLPASCMPERPDDLPGASAEASPAPSSGPSGVPADTASGIVAGIHRVSGSEVEVTESARNAFFADPAAATGSVRLVPRVRERGTVGIRVFGVKPGEVLAALGFENGDTIVAVDNRRIGGPEAMADAAPRVRTSPRVSLQLERHGKPVNIVVRVVPDKKAKPGPNKP